MISGDYFGTSISLGIIARNIAKELHYSKRVQPQLLNLSYDSGGGGLDT